MNPSKRQNIQRCLRVIMNWTLAVQEIKSNRAHNKTARQGHMYSLGYHGSMEKDKSMGYYAPGTSKDAFDLYVCV